MPVPIFPMPLPWLRLGLPTWSVLSGTLQPTGSPAFLWHGRSSHRPRATQGEKSAPPPRPVCCRLQTPLKCPFTPQQHIHPVGGRINHHLLRWQEITSDKWVLQIVSRGYVLPFLEAPPPLLPSLEWMTETILRCSVRKCKLSWPREL